MSRILMMCLVFVIACSEDRSAEVASDDPSPLTAAAATCPIAPDGLTGCVCGFKDTAPESEWPAYQAQCDFFGGFCAAQCCAPGREPRAGDHTRCTRTLDEPTKSWFNPYPDVADRASAMRLAWAVFGSDTCTVTGTIGTASFATTTGPIGNVDVGELVPEADRAPLAATVSCENVFGSLVSRIAIPSSDQRVTLSNASGSTRACWQVQPWYLSGKQPFRGSCHLEVCPPGAFFDPSSTFPCLTPSFTAGVTQTIGCTSIPGTLASTTKVSVSCESGDQQSEIDFTTVP